MPPDADRRPVHPQIVASRKGAMVLDAALAEAPAWEWFELAHWRARGALREAGGGRGGVAFIDTPIGACVLRHYRRGGWMAPLMGDRYLWEGRANTRSFAEFHLLADLRDRGLPVPAPVAACYVRRGGYYRADLITRAIPAAAPLSAVVAAGGLNRDLARRVGALVARFHAQGVDHADLNAHNILVNAAGLWLIDFDRGEIRVSGTAWKLSNLARLKRSLLKVGACDHDESALDREVWASLLEGYQQVLGNAG